MGLEKNCQDTQSGMVQTRFAIERKSSFQEQQMKFMAFVPAATLTVLTLMLAAAPAQVPGGGGAGGGAPGGGARGGRGGGGMPPIERAKANDLEKPTTPTKSVGADGFIQRWLILDPIPAQGVTQNEFQAVAKTQHFPNELTLVPHDGMTVT